jgi:hypothetical protein
MEILKSAKNDRQLIPFSVAGICPFIISKTALGSTIDVYQFVIGLVTKITGVRLHVRLIRSRQSLCH